MKRADDLIYLKWFYYTCKYGVLSVATFNAMADEFQDHTGKRPPTKYDVKMNNRKSKR